LSHGNRVANRGPCKVLPAYYLQASTWIETFQHVGETHHLSPVPCRKYRM